MWSRRRLHLLTLAGLFSLGWCLSKPKVHLGPDETEKYITFRDRYNDTYNYVLGCTYDLDEGEKVVSVTWHHRRLNDVVMVWRPRKSPLVYENFFGNVNMDRDDGNIEFSNVLLEFEGIYYCQISTNKISGISDPYELIVADMGNRRYSSSSIEVPGKQCREQYSFSTPAIYPPPKVDFGVWDGKDWVQKLMPVPHIFKNGSKQFSIKKHKFKTDQFPEGSTYRLVVGLEKQNGEYIPLSEKEETISPCTITEETDIIFTDGIEGSGNVAEANGQVGDNDGSDIVELGDGNELGEDNDGSDDVGNGGRDDFGNGGSDDVGNGGSDDVGNGGSDDVGNGVGDDNVNVENVQSVAASHSLSATVLSVTVLCYLGSRD